ncbi:hypothetical protein B5807_01482 [Epicoccum nigrum]|uniref:Uncharacterized protein n=1 Tax=Epicoccum nigrum TaxID=105696 RepID=A0A1Y2MFZ4_EPING|nr:hypothetical protein B5807_01482 [Epicoccum nigrum]
MLTFLAEARFTMSCTEYSWNFYHGLLNSLIQPSPSSTKTTRPTQSENDSPSAKETHQSQSQLLINMTSISHNICTVGYRRKEPRFCYASQHVKLEKQSAASTQLLLH